MTQASLHQPVQGRQINPKSRALPFSPSFLCGRADFLPPALGGGVSSVCLGGGAFLPFSMSLVLPSSLPYFELVLLPRLPVWVKRKNTQEHTRAMNKSSNKDDERKQIK